MFDLAPLPPESFAASAGSLLAFFPYCVTTDGETNDIERATIIPCEAFQHLLRHGSVDIARVIGNPNGEDEGEELEIDIIATDASLALVIRVNNVFLIGVRGTSYMYEWLSNLCALKLQEAKGEYHRGFWVETKKLELEICKFFKTKFNGKKERSKCVVYLSGHSLGGAIASLLDPCAIGLSPCSIKGTFVYGAPRTLSKTSWYPSGLPVQARDLQLDIIPHLPPLFAGYRNHKHLVERRLYPRGKLMELWISLRWKQWLRKNAKVKSNHIIEKYMFMEYLAIQCSTIPASSPYSCDQGYLEFPFGRYREFFDFVE